MHIKHNLHNVFHSPLTLGEHFYKLIFKKIVYWQIPHEENYERDVKMNSS